MQLQVVLYQQLLLTYYLLTNLLTYLFSHSRGTPLSHPHFPVGQLRSHVVGPEYVGQIQGSQVVAGGVRECRVSEIKSQVNSKSIDDSAELTYGAVWMR